MRLIIISIATALLTIGGFFGYKQYQRIEMRDRAIGYVLRITDRESKWADDAARDRVKFYINDLSPRTFSMFYRSGGFTQPAELDEAEFTRELFQVLSETVRNEGEPESVQRLATHLYRQTRPAPVQ
jgi:hypothetical protein